MNKKNELCFHLYVSNLNSINEDKMIDNLIDFSVKNNVSIGGNLNTGFYFCIEEGYLPENLKEKFILFTKTKYSSSIENIQFSDDS